MKRLFHIHIPKTGGTSLNALFDELFGDDFQNHNLTKENPYPQKKVVAAHRSFLSAQRNWPNYRYVAILREPVSRLHSNLSHFYSRRKNPKYHVPGALVEHLINDEFKPSCESFKNSVIWKELDNVMVRYLSNIPVETKVNQLHLLSAIESLKKIDYLFTLESINSEITPMLNWLGFQNAVYPHQNKGLNKKKLYEILPESLEQWVCFDRLLYNSAINSGTVKI